MNIIKKFWNWLNPPAKKVTCTGYQPKTNIKSVPPVEYRNTPLVRKKSVDQSYRDDYSHMIPYMDYTRDPSPGYSEPEPDTQFGGGRFGGGGASYGWEETPAVTDYRSDDSDNNNSDNNDSSSDSGDSGGGDD